MREARSWWAIAKAKATDGAKAKRKPRTKEAPPKPGWEPVDHVMEADKMKAKAQPNVGRALEVTPFKFLLRAVVVEQPVLQHDFSHELPEHVVQERLGGCQHARSEACEVGSEVRVSAAAVFPSRESDTHSKHTSRRLRRSEGVAVGKCGVRVGTVPLEPQSEAVGARERSALGLSVLKLQQGRAVLLQ